MTRRKLIAGNWKMNLSHNDAVALAREISSQSTRSVDVAILPPFPWLIPVRDALGTSGVKLGAQNCHWETSGAFTGEVSAPMLAETCDFIAAGHSERRHVFGEGDDWVARKVSAILAAGAEPILCVGETINEREAGDATAVVTRQLAKGLEAVDVDLAPRVTIAYEPVWAIGTGVAATTTDAQDMCAMIRSWLATRYGNPGSGVRILYGGSMTPTNAMDLLAQPDIDGGLVGGASLNADSFMAIVGAAESVSRM
ncbi:MAG TPA: triose-phosphate isomerase [Thermomicrobiales bacterium]|nr:triose-phosphate isomerase [Thermomicrobiales bacterium]